MLITYNFKIYYYRNKKNFTNSLSRKLKLSGIRRAVNVLHMYIKIRGIEVYKHVSNMRKIY